MTPETRLKLSLFRICYLMKMLTYEMLAFHKAKVPAVIKQILQRGVTIFGNVVIDLKLKLKTDEVFDRIIKADDDKVFAMMEVLEILMYMDAADIEDIARQLKEQTEVEKV